MDMAGGFTLQNMACLTLDGSGNEDATPSEAAATGEQQVPKEKSSSQEARDESTAPTTSHRRGSSSSSNLGTAGDIGGGGFLASGFSWFDKQREKRRRDHLKQEAEKQLQKIADAQRAARKSASGSNSTKNIHSSVNRNHSLISSSSSSSSPSQQDGMYVMPNNSLKSNASGSSDGGDCENGNDKSNAKQRQTQFYTQTSNSFGTSDVSKSGEGASGTLDLSDIDALGDGGVSNRKSPAKSTDDDESVYIIPPVRVTHVEGDEASPYILSQKQMDEIAKHVLPETITYCRWRRLYGLGRDGDSFEGCLRIIGAEKRTLMVVRTSKGDVFGGYADAPWHSRQANATAHFYGTASSCLFSFSSTLTEYSSSSSPTDSPINVYRWTGKNRYIQVCDVFHKMLAFGGGGDKGAFGLCLQDDFQRGTTGHCDTFDNDPLCSGDSRTFDVVDVEFWEFQTGVF